MTPDDDADQPDTRLARRLGARDTVVIGLGSMIGAGVFAAIGPAAAAAGGVRGIVEAGASLSFAFAGDARIATLREGVRVPARVTARAVRIAPASTLTRTERRWPRALTVAGLIGCVGLGLALPAASAIGGTVLPGAGAAAWGIRHTRIAADQRADADD